MIFIYIIIRLKLTDICLSNFKKRMTISVVSQYMNMAPEMLENENLLKNATNPIEYD